MNVAFACPKCEQTAQVPLDDEPLRIACTHCSYSLAVPPGSLAQGRVERCVICGGAELFVRKDFSQRLGVMIVVLGFTLSSITWYFHQVYATYGILFATALIDIVLYMLMGNLLQCYRCRSEYRGVAGLDTHEPFSLETHERHRQQAARLAESQSAAAVAGKSRPSN